MEEKPRVDELLPSDSAIRAQRRALEDELMRTPPSGRARRKSTRAAVVLAALVAIGTGAAWAAGVFSASEISFQSGVGCYSEARLHGSHLSVTVTHAAADPVAKCEKYWREGVVDTTMRRLGREGKVEYPRGHYPPHLVACADEGAGISVFPGSDGVCEKLGLEPLPADYAAPGREAARAYTAWNRILARPIRVKPGGCSSPGPVAERARRLLAAHGYADVPVRISSDGPCAKSVESRGRAIEVLTTTPHEDDVARLAERSFDALSDLFERASLKCIAPEKFGALAREVLDRAGLDQVRVGVSQKRFPCTYGSGGFSPESLRMDIGASSHKTWRFNRAGFLRYKRQLRHRRHEEAIAHKALLGQ
jgi:hypothetical protein